MQGHTSVRKDPGDAVGPLLSRNARHYLGSEYDVHLGAGPDVTVQLFFVFHVLTVGVGVFFVFGLSQRGPQLFFRALTAELTDGRSRRLPDRVKNRPLLVLNFLFSAHARIISEVQ